MAKTYTLQGPITLEGLSNTDALTFVGAVINAIPSYSMGTASLSIDAQGPAGGSSRVVSGKKIEELKSAFEKVKGAPKAPEDIVYNVSGKVDLVGLSIADGIEVVDTVLHAIPGDSLVMTSMLAQST
jgi:hypothetical protein